MQKNSTNNPKHAEIERKYYSLNFLIILYQNMMAFSNYDAKIFSEIITLLKIKYLNQINIQNQNVIELIHEFLIKCVRKLNQHVFFENMVSQCCNQKRKSYRCILTDDCIDCRVCDSCEVKMRSTLTDYARTVCLSCKREITVRFDHATNSISMSIREIPELKNFYKLIQEKLNSFYYNAVEFLFRNEGQYSHKKLVEPILEAVSEGKITVRDEQSYQLDLNEYYRLSLLEFFYKKHRDCMLRYLEPWFRNACKLSTQNATKMAILFENCVQEIYHDDDELVYNDPQAKINSALRLSAELVSDLVSERRILVSIFGGAGQKEFNVHFLLYLAKLKFCLKALAKFNCNEELFEAFSRDASYLTFNANIRTLLELPECAKKNVKVFDYLVKEIIRKYGAASVKMLTNHDELSWMVPKDIFGVDFKVSDKYLLSGDEYSTLRQAIQTCFHDNNASALETIFKQRKVNFSYLAIALYRNVTFMYKTLPNVPASIFESVLTKHYDRYESHWHGLLRNDIIW